MAVQRKAKPPVTVAGLREYLLQLGKPGDVSLSTLCLTKRCGIVFERPKNARDVGHETLASRVYRVQYLQRLRAWDDAAYTDKRRAEGGQGWTTLKNRWEGMTG